MKILLIKPPVSKHSTINYFAVEPPLGLIYLSAFLKTHGYGEIKIIHMVADAMTFDEFKELAKEYNPDIVGISALTSESEGMHRVAAIVKEICAGSLVVAGGPHPTAYIEDSLSNKNIDMIVKGEGEETFLEIVQNFRDKKPLDEIYGIYFRHNGHIVRTKTRNYINDLDELPFPDWDIVKIERYKNLPAMSCVIHQETYMPILTSRGCPFHCIYCHDIFGKYFRAHSPVRVLNEIKTLHGRFGVNNFEIMDDIFNFDRQRVIDIMKGIIDSGLKIRLFFPNGLRGDMLDREIIDLFTKAGVVYISVGIETASPRLQKEIKKYIALHKIKKVIANVAKARIFINGFFMLGFPDETLMEVLSTIKFAITSNLHLVGFFLVHPFKGTEIEKILRKNGKKTISVNSSNNYQIITRDSVNCSKFSRMQLELFFSSAEILFYLNPFRVWRIIRDIPDKKVLKIRVAQFLKCLFINV